jgi:hypothetical protein
VSLLMPFSCLLLVIAISIEVSGDLRLPDPQIIQPVDFMIGRSPSPLVRSILDLEVNLWSREVPRLCAQVGREDVDRAVRSAVWHGYLTTVRALKTYCGGDIVSPDEDGVTPLMLAASAGHIDVVGALLEMNAPIYAVSRSHQSAIEIARKGGHLKVAQLLADSLKLKRAFRYLLINSAHVTLAAFVSTLLGRLIMGRQAQ